MLTKLPLLMRTCTPAKPISVPPCEPLPLSSLKMRPMTAPVGWKPTGLALPAPFGATVTVCGSLAVVSILPTGSLTLALYCPAANPAAVYSPLELVVAVTPTPPPMGVTVTVNPAMPDSPASCTPLPLASVKTRPTSPALAWKPTGVFVAVAPAVTTRVCGSLAVVRIVAAGSVTLALVLPAGTTAL